MDGDALLFTWFVSHSDPHLLDAQNSALVAELNASNAVYDFLLDLVELQRSVGRLEWFKYEEDQQAWIGRIRDYFEEVRRSGEDVGGFE